MTISYEFDMRKFSEIDVGVFFMWGGQLYLKTEPEHHSYEDDYNAANLSNANIYSFFPEEKILPVKVDIRVSQIDV